MKNHFLWLPKALVYLRLLLAFVLPLLTYFYFSKGGVLLVVLLWIGLLSDIFDGILARRWGVCTEALRRADARVDVVFWLSAGFCVVMVNFQIIQSHFWGIVLLFCFEPISDIIHLIRFGKDGNSHNWLSKLWGIFLLITFSGLLLNMQVETLFQITIGLGLISQMDRITIAILLPKSEGDIPSFWHAYQLKKGKKIKRYSLFN